MYTFLLNDKQINVVNAPILNECLDESPDTIEVVLEVQDRLEPYEPHSSFKVLKDDKVIFDGAIISDSVEVACKSPLEYIHSISCHESIRETQFLFVRDTSFTQYYTDRELVSKQQYIFPFQNGSGIKVISASPIGDDKVPIKFSKFRNANLDKIVIECEIYDYENDLIKVVNPNAKYKNIIGFTLIDKTTNEIIFSYGNNDYFEKVIHVEIPISRINFDHEYAFSFNKFPESYVDKTKNLPYATFNCYIYAIRHKYTLYDVLDTLRRQQILKAKNGNNVYLTKCDYQFKLPTSGRLYNLLYYTIAPDFVFTDCSLWDCLVDIFQYIDAEPKFSLDGTKTLEAEFYNDKQRKIDLNGELTNFTTSINNKNYVNDFVTKYQNARIKNSVTYPSNSVYKNVSGNKISITNENDYLIMTDKPIDYVEHLYFNLQGKTLKAHFAMYTTRIVNNEVIGHTLDIRDVDKDILFKSSSEFDYANQVVTKDVYMTLPEPGTSESEVIRSFNKATAFSYEQGDNKIEFLSNFKNIFGFQFSSIKYALGYLFINLLGGITSSGIGDNKWIVEVETYDIQYRVIYKPQLEGLTKSESIENKAQGFYTRIAQANGGTMLEKLGRNASGVALRSGVPNITISKKIDTLENMFKKGDYVLENGIPYVVNKTSTTFYNDFAFQTIELTKNFNRFNQFTRIDRQKRFSEFSKNLIARSEDYITEYAVVSLNKGVNEETFINHDTFYFCIEKSLDRSVGISTNTITSACFTPLNEDNTTQLQKGYSVLAPIAIYTTQSTINFEVSFDNAKIVTYNMEQRSDDKKITQYVYYTGKYGEFKKCDLKLGQIISSDNWLTANKISPYLEENTTFNDFINIKQLEYYKKPNEIFAFNYQLAFVPSNAGVEIIGSSFIENTLITKDLDKSIELHLFGMNRKLSPLEDKVMGCEKLEKIRLDMTTQGEYVILNKLQKPYEAWGICDNNYNVFLAFNEDVNETSTLKFYINLKHKR